MADLRQYGAWFVASLTMFAIPSAVGIADMINDSFCEDVKQSEDFPSESKEACSSGQTAFFFLQLGATLLPAFWGYALMRPLGFILTYVIAIFGGIII